VQPLKRTGRPGDARGFSLMQMVVTIAIASTIMLIAVMGLRSARAAMRLHNSARQFAANIEKARLDAIRRHDSTNVEFTSATTYEITMDFAGNGTKQTRAFTLEGGISLVDSNGNVMSEGPYPYADFDWRGRTSECSMPFQMQGLNSSGITVQVAGSGDISVNNTSTTVPTVSFTPVSASTDIAPNTIVTGADTRLNLTPCSQSTVVVGGGGTTPATTQTATCTAGTLSLNPGYLSVRRNGGTSGTAAATVTTPGTLSFTADPNLSVTAGSSQFIQAVSGGRVSYTVRSITRNRGTFPVKFNFSNCTPVTLYVKVTN
jgi:Tfp pilus assembly protein FimT